MGIVNNKKNPVRLLYFAKLNKRAFISPKSMFLGSHMVD